MLHRVEALCCSLDDYFFNDPHAGARFRSQYEKCISGPVVLMSEFLVAAIASPAFKQQVEGDLGVVGG